MIISNRSLLLVVYVYNHEEHIKSLFMRHRGHGRAATGKKSARRRMATSKLLSSFVIAVVSY